MTLENDFLMSVLVDARGGAVTSQRMRGLKLTVPPGCVHQPTRVRARQARPQDIKFGSIKNYGLR